MEASWRQARDLPRRGAGAARRPRRLCRHLTLEGFGDLALADGAGEKGGLVLPILPFGSWPLALALVGLYRGGVTIAGEPPRWRGAQRALAELPAEVRPGDGSNGGERRWAISGWPTDGRAGADDPDSVDVPFLATRLRVSTAPARFALDRSADLCPVGALAEDGGGWTFWAAQADPSPDVTALSRAWVEPYAGAVRRRPDLWPWFLPQADLAG
ncbi:MAG: hypothetical protein AAGN66_01565 [Acidobacteriota bacterium]